MLHQRKCVRTSKPAKSRKASESSEGSSNASDVTPDVENVSNSPSPPSPGGDQAKKAEIYPWMKESRTKGRKKCFFFISSKQAGIGSGDGRGGIKITANMFGILSSLLKNNALWFAKLVKYRLNIFLGSLLATATNPDKSVARKQKFIITFTCFLSASFVLTFVVKVWSLCFLLGKYLATTSGPTWTVCIFYNFLISVLLW